MTLKGVCAVALAAVASLAISAGGALAKGPPYKVYLSLSYTGNDWQSEAENMIRALATSDRMKDKVKLEVEVSGANAQKQSQQINAMVQAGADVIVMYGSSETLLNGAIKNACDKGVIVFAYDSFVSEPCAYNVTTDATAFGRTGAEWLVKAMHEKGNVVMITGVPGFSTDTARNNAAKAVFAKYPNIKVIASVPAMWSESVLRSELSKVLATKSWDDIDGLWIQVGCDMANTMEDEAGIPDDKKRPCAGEATNGHRLQMLPSGTPVEGANGTYRPMGYPSISVTSGPFEGALALQYAIDILEGKPHEHLNIVKIPSVTNETSKLCKEGTWQEMHDVGCTAFSPKVVANPGWFASIYSPELPGIGLQAALSGKPEN
jgi:ribose transport system substrate-binding protein